ncbi:MAG: HPr family phosphocarrier protein [Phycisphaerales bacterium]
MTPPDEAATERNRVSNEVKAQVVVRNRLGLHARPAMTFVDAAMAFDAAITVRRAEEDGEEVDGKSIMEMMMLAATQGTTLEIKAVGDDAQTAIEQLSALVEGGFDED